MTDFRSDGGNAPFLHAFTEREKATAASFHPIRRPFSAVQVTNFDGSSGVVNMHADGAAITGECHGAELPGWIIYPT